MDLLLIICLVVTIEPGKCVLYSSVGGMKRTKRAVSGDLEVESSKKLKSSAVDGITVSAGQMKNVIKFEENVLATRDDLRDNRWVKDKLSKVRDGGSLDAVKERFFGVKIPKFEEIISLLFQHFTASATNGTNNPETTPDLTCGAKSVTGDSIRYESDCFNGTLNPFCAPVKNLLTHSDNETYDGADGPSTFWLGPDGNNANFILDLGCQHTFDTIQLVNTHASYWRDGATKQFKLYVGNTKNGPWTWVLEATLNDSRQQNDPLPLQYLALETGEKTAQFVKFELIEPWGDGGGLQYFDIERNSFGTTISDVLLYCGERAKTLTGEMDRTSHATAFDLQCCHNGIITNTTCGMIVNGTYQNCSTACGAIECAKIVPDNEQEKCNQGENQMWIKQNDGYNCTDPEYNPNLGQTDIECSNCRGRNCTINTPCWICTGYFLKCFCKVGGWWC